MAKILVTRSGSPLWWNTMMSRRVSETGEMDTEPLIRYLSSAGHDVGFYGHLRNYDEAPLPGLRTFTIDFSGCDKFHSEALEHELMARCDPVIDEILRWEPDIVLEVEGEKYTWWRPCNDNGVEILDVCWKFGFPIGYMYHRTRYKRNIIVTDPVPYPRHGDMLGSWPECLPNAVLSQEETQWVQDIQRRRVRIKARYCGCENWLTWEIPEDNCWNVNAARDTEVFIAAHPHHKRALQNERQRRQLWQGILDECPRNGNTKMCGRGWDDGYALPSDDSYIGILPNFMAVMAALSKSVGGPVVPQKWGFNSTKPRLYALCGACPYMFERDPAYRYTYDKDGRILPLAHPSRWDWDGPSCLFMGEWQRQDTVAKIVESTRPNFDVLHEFIECGGHNPDGKFGGYWVK